MKLQFLKDKLIPVLISVFGFLICFALLSTGPKIKPQAPDAKPPLVRVLQASPNDHEFKAYARGTVMPRSETAVMVVTVIGTVATGNLAVGVSLGVLAAMIGFARRVAHLTIVECDDATPGTRIYRVRGELFFASSNDLIHQFDYANDPDAVVIDLSGADVWDASSVATLDSIRQKYEARGKAVSLTGLDGASLERLTRLSGRLGV